MPSITLNYSTQAAVKIKEAIDFANTLGGEPGLPPQRTAKQWIALIVKDWAVNMLVRKQQKQDSLDQAAVRDAALAEVEIE